MYKVLVTKWGMIVSVPELFELHEDVLVDGLVEEGVPDRRDHVGDDGVVQVRRGGHLSLHFGMKILSSLTLLFLTVCCHFCRN